MQHVPVWMAGTATLTTVFYLVYLVLIRTGHDYPIAVYDALLAAGGFMLLMRPWHHRPAPPAPHR